MNTMRLTRSGRTTIIAMGAILVAALVMWLGGW